MQNKKQELFLVTTLQSLGLIAPPRQEVLECFPVEVVPSDVVPLVIVAACRSQGFEGLGNRGLRFWGLGSGVLKRTPAYGVDSAYRLANFSLPLKTSAVRYT